MSNLQHFTEIKDSVVVVNLKSVLGAGDGSLTFKGNATQDTHSQLNYTLENLTSVENSIFVVNSENIHFSPLSSNSQSASLSSVCVRVDQGDKVAVSDSVPLPNYDDQSLVSGPSFENKVRDESHKITSEKGDETFKFSIEKDILVKVNNEDWDLIFKEENTLPYNWTNCISDLISKYLPNCSINFKRRKVYPPGSKYIAKFWFYCSIADCLLESTAQLCTNRNFIIQNKNTSLSHTRGVYKSFQSRFVRGKDRVKLGKSVSGLSYPSKEFHKRLANLDENSFSAGNLRDTPMSKNVIKQCAYEYRKLSLEDKDVIQSIQLLQQKFSKETQCKSTRGYIQFFSINPFTIALWTEKDIELYHKMSYSHSLLVDATGSIATKLTDKEIFYFSFISYDMSVKTEPIPHLELLTDLSTNNNSVESYLGRSYQIVTGKATTNDLKKNKTFLLISLCHSMKALAHKVNKCFKTEKNFVKYCLSLLANSCSLSDALLILKHFFKLLLCKFSDDCSDAESFLD